MGERERVVIRGTCPRCGKQYATDWTRASTPDTAPLLQRLMDRSLCRACSMESHQERDECPETYYGDDGHRMACGRGWKHDGPCESMVTRAQLDTAFAAARAKEGDG